MQGAELGKTRAETAKNDDKEKADEEPKPDEDEKPSLQRTSTMAATAKVWQVLVLKSVLSMIFRHLFFQLNSI